MKLYDELAAWWPLISAPEDYTDEARKYARLLLPAREVLELSHVAGDMRTVRLGRTFDAVFVHDAIMYMTTESDLRAALSTVATHLRPGGTALLVPDATRECFHPDATAHGHDGADGRSARLLEWTLPVEPGDTTYAVHYAILLRERDGAVRVVHDERSVVATS